VKPSRPQNQPLPARAATSNNPPEKSAFGGRVGKLQSVDRLGTDILSRLATMLQEDPASIVNPRSAMLPREVEDGQAYFLQKVVHARQTLRELADLLALTPGTLDRRELISTELMILFVLMESYRPERISESGWKLDEDTQARIREKIESLRLDVINIRERLK
jgi:hypothetical protein